MTKRLGGKTVKNHEFHPYAVIRALLENYVPKGLMSNPLSY